MSASNELYQQVILDHNRNPRNFRTMDEATHVCHGHNPLCGDNITVFAKVGVAEDGRETLEDLSFQGSGCAISKASSSLMTTQLKGKPVRSCRMVSDVGRDDLLRMAIRLGLPAYWMRRDPVDYFELVEWKRPRAIRFGAQPVSPRRFREIVDKMMGAKSGGDAWTRSG